MAKKDTLDSTLAPDAPIAALIYASARSPGLTVSKYLYSLINCSFPTSSISTKTYFKKLKIQMTIKLLSTNYLHPTLFHFFPRGFDLPPGSTVSNSPYPLRNCNFHATSTTTKIKTKKQKLKLMISLLSTTPLSPTLFPLFT